MDNPAADIYTTDYSTEKKEEEKWRIFFHGRLASHANRGA